MNSSAAEKALTRIGFEESKVYIKQFDHQVAPDPYALAPGGIPAGNPDAGPVRHEQCDGRHENHLL